MSRELRSILDTPKKDPYAEKRRWGRFKPGALTCSLGDILDISGGGARVRSPRPVEGEHELVIQGTGVRVQTRVRIAWQTKIGFRDHLLGVAFVDLTPQLKKDLARLQQSHYEPGITKRPKLQGSDTNSRYPLVLIGMGIVSLLTGIMVSVTEHEPWGPSLGGEERAELIFFYVGQVGIIAGLLLSMVGLMWASRNLEKQPAPQRTEPTKTEHLAPELKVTKPLLDSILESTLGGVMVLKAVRNEQNDIEDFDIQLVNTTATHIVGQSYQLLVRNRLHDRLVCLKHEPFYRDVLSVIETGLTYRDERQLGRDQRWYKFAAARLGDGLVVTFEDTTQEQKNAEQLRRIACYDPLTKLPNRKLFTEQLDRAMTRRQRIAGFRFAVFFLDFDGFKKINDTLGHDAGDDLLIGISQRLDEVIRSSDTLSLPGAEFMAARLGGDEFVVLLEHIQKVSDATSVAGALVQAFEAPHHIKGQEVVSTSSIGIVCSNPRQTTTDDVLREADFAMYKAKSSGKSRYVIYEDDMVDEQMPEVPSDREPAPVGADISDDSDRRLSAHRR